MRMPSMSCMLRAPGRHSSSSSSDTRLALLLSSTTSSSSSTTSSSQATRQARRARPQHTAQPGSALSQVIGCTPAIRLQPTTRVPATTVMWCILTTRRPALSSQLQTWILTKSLAGSKPCPRTAGIASREASCCRTPEPLVQLGSHGLWPTRTHCMLQQLVVMLRIGTCGQCIRTYSTVTTHVTPTGQSHIRPGQAGCPCCFP